MTLTKAELNTDGHINPSQLSQQPSLMISDTEEQSMNRLATAMRVSTQQESSVADTMIEIEEVETDPFASHPLTEPQIKESKIAKSIKNMRETGNLENITADAHLGYVESGDVDEKIAHDT